MRKRDQIESLGEDLPVDVMPASNGEYLPGEVTPRQREIMRLANAETEAARRRFNMSRRDFVRTSAAMSIGVWAIDAVAGGRWGRYALAEHDKTNAACDLEYPGAQLGNLPGEFIFDVQSHHVDSGGLWRATNPGLHGLFTAIWTQSGPLGGRPGVREDGSLRGFGKGTEIDPIENLSRYHYFKELYLDSSTNMTVLSAVPANAEDQNCLPVDEAALTVGMVNGMAQNTPRAVMHAFVMPNRGSLGHNSAGRHKPVFFNEEMEMMERNVLRHPGYIRGWKVYCPWGDVRYASGWFLDDDFGLEFIANVQRLGNKYGIPKTIASHKGFALPGFDQRAAACRDVGPAAKAFPDVNFIIYHSGYDGETVEPYPGDDKVDSSVRSIDSLIKSLRENKWDATRFVKPGMAHGNTPNVYAELGAVWRENMGSPDEAAHLLGKLITYVGPRRVVWGTDSLWFGSPQPEIVGLRAFEMTDKAKELYNLPYGLDGDRFDPRRNAMSGSSYIGRHPSLRNWPKDGKAHPERSIRNGIFGRNVAKPYGVDPDAVRKAIDCDEVQAIRDGYLLNSATPDPRQAAPFRSNTMAGHRTNAGILDELVNSPWSP